MLSQQKFVPRTLVWTNSLICLDNHWWFSLVWCNLRTIDSGSLWRTDLSIWIISWPFGVAWRQSLPSVTCESRPSLLLSEDYEKEKSRQF
jgi:hypothetical protein